MDHYLANLCDGMCSVITSFHKPWCKSLVSLSHILNIIIWCTSYHWIFHVLHHKQLFITLIISWCIILLLWLSIPCIMFLLIIELCHVHRFFGVVAAWVDVWLLTSMTSPSSKISLSTSMRLTFMLMMSTMWALMSTLRWGCTTSTSTFTSIWIEGTFFWSSIGWSTNNVHFFIYK